MNFISLLTSLALLSIAALIHADMDGPELEQGLKMALDQFVQVNLDKSLGGDERATQLQALVHSHPLFVYADADKVNLTADNWNCKEVTNSRGKRGNLSSDRKFS
jgi:hypothetical protein